MTVKVRRAEKNDIPAIVEVNCSDVEQWYHFTPRGRAGPASYEELSSWERVMHGGPWMRRRFQITGREWRDWALFRS